MKWILALAVMASPAAADPFAVVDAARAMFDRVPQVQVIDPEGEPPCGAGDETNEAAFYCTSDKTIYHVADFASTPQAGYEMAHLLGHAMQVEHGVADVALREISRRRDEEEALRGMVTRQVECVAGVFVARAELDPVDLAQLFEDEPFTHSHWGRSPVNEGPRVSIGLAARQEWFDIGYGARDVAACSVGEMVADLLVAAQKSEATTGQ